MIEYAHALEILLGLPLDPGVEKVPLLAANGRFLAEDVVAPFSMPRFDNSAMDGFAVRACDLLAATPESPVRLPIVGESAAGRRHNGPVPPNSAIRISTGAFVPEDLDSIVPIEAAEVADGTVVFTAPATPGLYRRRCGADVAAGSVILRRGERLGPTQLAFIASFNLERVLVYRRLRVGIMTSGDEVRALGEPLGADDIVGSSLYYLTEELAQCGCEPRLYGIARDDVEDYCRRFGEMLDWSDLLITTAGVSVGTHDVVGEVIQRFGGHVHFWKVAVRPGKPMLVASYGAKHHLGFPGNPVSTCCNTEIFLKPLLRKAFGSDAPIAPTRLVPLESDCPADPMRLFFVHAELRVDAEGNEQVRPLPNQNSGNLGLCARANALIIVPAGPHPLPKGTRVSVLQITQGLQRNP